MIIIKSGTDTIDTVTYMYILVYFYILHNTLDGNNKKWK